MSLLGGLNWLDIFILFALFFGLAIGYMQGFVRQLIGLGALYIGAILGAQYYRYVADWIQQVFPNAPARLVNGLGFFLILIVVTSILNWLAFDAYGSGTSRRFPMADHLGGSVLGLVTVFIVITMLIPIASFATGEIWPYADDSRYVLMYGLQTSQLVDFFDIVKPLLLSSLTPWLPGGLPSIFNL